MSGRIAAINENIRDGIRGPEFNLTLFNVDRIVEQWQRAQGRSLDDD